MKTGTTFREPHFGQGVSLSETLSGSMGADKPTIVILDCPYLSAWPPPLKRGNLS
jgi:hypothetical protein